MNINLKNKKSIYKIKEKALKTNTTIVISCLREKKKKKKSCGQKVIDRAVTH